MSGQRVSRIRTQAGFTLMEILIAVTLVSLLSVAMLMAMRVGLGAMEKSNDRLIANRRAVGVQRILEQQIAGLIPVIADCKPNPVAPKQRVSFFDGEPQSLRFVTSYSMTEASRGYPRLVEYAVIPGADGVGVRLVVNELLYTGSEGAGAMCLGLFADPVSGAQVPRYRPVEPGPGSFVLADRLASCRFGYREALRQPPHERWHPRWMFRDWPTAVMVEMIPLNADPSRLQPVSIIAPVHITRVTHLGPYFD